MVDARYRESPGWLAAIAAGATAWVAFLVLGMAAATALGNAVMGQFQGWWPGWPLSITIVWAAAPALIALCVLTPLLVGVARRRERLLTWWPVTGIALLGAALPACGVLAVLLPYVPIIASDREDPGRTSAELVTTALVGYAIAGAGSAVAGRLVLAAAKARDESRSEALRRMRSQSAV